MFGLFSNPKIEEVAKCANAAIKANKAEYFLFQMKKVTKSYLKDSTKQMLENADVRSIAAFVLAAEGYTLSAQGEDEISNIFFASIPTAIKGLGFKALSSKDQKLHDDDLRYIKMAKNLAQKAGVEILS